MASRAGFVRRRRWLAGAIALGLIALLAAGFFVASRSEQTRTPIPIGTRPSIDRDSAITLARDFFGAAYPGGTVAEVTVDDATLGTAASGRAAWRVTIHGSVVAGGGTASTRMILDIDAETGAITVFAQG